MADISVCKVFLVMSPSLSQWLENRVWRVSPSSLTVAMRRTQRFVLSGCWLCVWPQVEPVFAMERNAGIFCGAKDTTEWQTRVAHNAWRCNFIVVKRDWGCSIVSAYFQICVCTKYWLMGDGWWVEWNLKSLHSFFCIIDHRRPAADTRGSPNPIDWLILEMLLPQNLLRQKHHNASRSMDWRLAKTNPPNA